MYVNYLNYIRGVFVYQEKRSSTFYYTYKSALLESIRFFVYFADQSVFKFSQKVFFATYLNGDKLEEKYTIRFNVDKSDLLSFINLNTNSSFSNLSDISQDQINCIFNKSLVEKFASKFLKNGIPKKK